MDGGAKHTSVLDAARASVPLDSKHQEWKREVVLTSALNKSVVEDTSKEFILVPNNLPAVEVLCFGRFRDERCSPCCIDSVSMSAACDFWGEVVFGP